MRFLRLRMNVYCAGPGGLSLCPGQVVDVKEELARSWIAQRAATEVDSLVPLCDPRVPPKAVPSELRNVPECLRSIHGSIVGVRKNGDDDAAYGEMLGHWMGDEPETGKWTSDVDLAKQRNAEKQQRQGKAHA